MRAHEATLAPGGEFSYDVLNPGSRGRTVILLRSHHSQPNYSIPLHYETYVDTNVMDYRRALPHRNRRIGMACSITGRPCLHNPTCLIWRSRAARYLEADARIGGCCSARIMLVVSAVYRSGWGSQATTPDGRQHTR